VSGSSGALLDVPGKTIDAGSLGRLFVLRVWLNSFPAIDDDNLSVYEI
jgi:hypothetical protein